VSWSRGEELAALRVELAGLRSELADARGEIITARGEITAARSEIADARRELQQGQDEAVRVLGQVRAITGAHFDRTTEHRRELVAVRGTEDYRAAYTAAEPLVTVRIATYNRPDVLFDRTIPSVLNQTHGNLELIVVGDGAGPEVVARAAQVEDRRFRFVNLPHRGVYPEDPQHRWLVAGSPGMNVGAQLAAGDWIAPLDDDDEFSPDHVEHLLDCAREGRFEMVYGRMRVVPGDGSEPYELGTYPPVHGQFGFQAAMYAAPLRFFEYETSSWVLGEPGDWNLCRRMMAAGVRIGYLPQVVTTLYPAGPDS
jgi:hypothetical protein